MRKLLPLLMLLAAGPAFAQPAPRLPAPAVADNAPPAAFLQDARRAIAAGRTAQAMEALERAESRVLQRIADTRAVRGPASNALINTITDARHALAAGDRASADRNIADALARIPPNAR